MKIGWRERLWFVLASLCAACGCAWRGVGPLPGDVRSAAAAHDDAELVAAALPAYLLFLDAAIVSRPGDRRLLAAGAELYGLYAALAGEQGARARRLTERSLRYAAEAVAVRLKSSRDLRAMTYAEFERTLLTTKPAAVPELYALGSSWAAWIRAHADDVRATAEIPRAEAVMRRVADLRPSYRGGSAFLYLGAMAAMLPGEMGGNAAQAAADLERAIDLSGGDNLMARVLYAERFVRGSAGEEAYRRWLRDVAESEANGEFGLLNRLARREARRLLEEAESE